MWKAHLNQLEREGVGGILKPAGERRGGRHTYTSWIGKGWKAHLNQLEREGMEGTLKPAVERKEVGATSKNR